MSLFLDITFLEMLHILRIFRETMKREGVLGHRVNLFLDLPVCRNREQGMAVCQHCKLYHLLGIWRGLRQKGLSVPSHTKLIIFQTELPCPKHRPGQEKGASACLIHRLSKLNLEVCPFV